MIPMEELLPTERGKLNLLRGSLIADREKTIAKHAHLELRTGRSLAIRRLLNRMPGDREGS